MSEVLRNILFLDQDKLIAVVFVHHSLFLASCRLL